MNTDSTKKRRAALWWLAALAGGLLSWAILSWPVPRFFSAGIAASHRTQESRADRVLIPGDHLQLLYHFWLARDMVAGRTPAFSDAYQFNADSTDPAAEAARTRRIDPYYAPFSLVYAAVSPVFGDAAGWNAAALLSVLLGALGSFALARRFTVSNASSLVASLVATAFPYRWITLHAGSPTGFAMGLAPFIPLGLDIAVRERRAAGGLVAGAALFLAYCSDLHVFYFSAISAPAWCLFSWLCIQAPQMLPSRDPGAPARARWFDGIPGIILALLPALAVAAACAAAGSLLNNGFSGTDMAGGRTWDEVKLFSPKPYGLLHPDARGMGCHLFLTLSLPALLAIGACCAATDRRDAAENARHPRIGPIWATALLAAAAIGVVTLALGSNCPLGALPMRLARKLVPHYGMIRQPVKIYCLMPSIAAVLLALTLPRRSRHPGIHFIAMILVALYFEEARSAMRPSISLLPREQPVYAAVASDAASLGRTPHAIALPIWPGDSHWSSPYLYGVMHSRVRLVNGYSPAKRDDYVENIFRFYESMNEGEVSGEQLDRLLSSGVTHVILHEDAFPEKVSPRPASTTLRRLAAHPRLLQVAADGPVRAFRILAEDAAPRAHALWTETVESVSTVNWKARAATPPPPLGDDAADGFRFAAADLFHAGETVDSDGSVRLSADRDPAGAIVYGPNRRLPPGTYSAALEFDAGDAPSGTLLGTFAVRGALPSHGGEGVGGGAEADGGGEPVAARVAAGGQCRTPAFTAGDAPLRFEFDYSRLHDARIIAIDVKREEPRSPQ